MSVVIPNTEDEKLDFVVPTRADGTFYRYEMICDNGWSRVYSDTLTDLLERLIPAYGQKDAQQRLTARIQHATDLQVGLQAQVNLSYDDSALTAEERELVSGPRHLQPQIESWDADFPLILVDAFYAPYSPLVVPVSGLSNVQNAPNLWWLKPAAGEFEYLQSLHDLAVVELHMLKDEAI
jgi:hypothetical protein